MQGFGLLLIVAPFLNEFTQPDSNLRFDSTTPEVRQMTSKEKDVVKYIRESGDGVALPSVIRDPNVQNKIEPLQDTRLGEPLIASSTRPVDPPTKSDAVSMVFEEYARKAREEGIASMPPSGTWAPPPTSNSTYEPSGPCFEANNPTTIFCLR